MSTPFRLKSSPAKLWPWGKTTDKSTTIEDGYEIKKRTSTKRGVVTTKTSRKLLANEASIDGIWEDTNITKVKDGKVIKSKNVIIDKDGKRKTKTTTKKGKTKKVVWDDGEKTVTEY